MHPGVELTDVVEGEAELAIDGRPRRVVHAGEAFQVPPNTAQQCYSTSVVEKEMALVIPV